MTQRLSFRIIVWMSWLFLTLERLAVSYWPLLTLAMLIASLAGFGILGMLPLWLHITLLLAYLAGTAFLIWHPRVPYHPATRREVLAAIETQNGLSHAPLQLLEDTLPPQTDAKALVFWERARSKAGKVKQQGITPYRPWPSIANQDPHGIRHAIALAFVLLILSSPATAWQRIANGAWPDMSQGSAATTPRAIEAWVTPPEYTGKPAVVLATGRPVTVPKKIDLPENSLLHLRISGYSLTPRIRANGDTLKLKEDAKGYISADIPLTESGSLSIGHFLSTIAKTDVTIIPDTPPELKLYGAEDAHMGGVRLSYMAQDDYGVTKLYGTLETRDRKGFPSEVIFDMPAPMQSADFSNSIQDFSSLPVAGGQAMITLTAEDAAGHSVTTPQMQISIPERKFNTPVAATIAYERKRLMAFDNPITRKLAIYGLMEAVRFPANYKGDPIVFMGLMSSMRRLALDRDNTSVDSVAPLLWDLALRLEDGGLMTATMDASKALDQLQKALSDKNASTAEIAAAMDAAQRAMNAYMQAFAREMLQRMQQGQRPIMLSPELAAKLSQRVDMGSMAKAMQMMRQMNDRAAMQKLAKQMQDALQSMDLNKMDQMNRQTQEALKALDALSPLIEDQRTVYDITRMSDDGAMDPRLPLAQGKLSDRLNAIIKSIRGTLDVPENLPAAEKLMQDAKKLLSANDKPAAAKAQSQALTELQRGMNNAAQKMAEMLRQKMTILPGMSGAPQPGNSDPFGRGFGNTQETGVTLPDQEQQGRVQRIIRDLRNRANDQNRPKVERDYIDRLLDMMN